TVKAIVEASGTGVIPPEQVLRLLLTALGVTDVDGIVEKMIDPDTREFMWPKGPPLGGGRDPLDPGDSMRPDRDPDIDGGDDEGSGQDDESSNEDDEPSGEDDNDEGQQRRR